MIVAPSIFALTCRVIITSRPCLKAWFAVADDPDRSSAAIMIVFSESPVIISLRRR